MSEWSEDFERKIQWNISFACNFQCEYCFASADMIKWHNENSPRNISLDPVLESFNSLEGEWLIVLGGGEPFFQKNFVDLCVGLQDKHKLIIVSNLTHSVDDFIERVNPDRIQGIAASLHIDMREKSNGMSRFIVHVKKLMDSDFPVQVSQVMYPPLINRFEDLRYEMQVNDIRLYPKVFEGTYDNKPYPFSYTDADKEQLKEWIEFANMVNKDYRYSEDILFGAEDGKISFKDQMCNAGVNNVVINEHGSVYRCWNMGDDLGNIFHGGFHLLDKTTSCPFDKAQCPQMCYDCIVRNDG